MLIPQYKLGHSGPPPAHTRCLRRGAGRDAEQAEAGERRQCPVVESSGESSARFYPVHRVYPRFLHRVRTPEGENQRKDYQ